MIVQLALGTAVILASIFAAGAALWAIEELFLRLRRWASHPPHRLRLATMASLATLVVMAQITAAVWLWGLTFYALDLFDALEPAVYFALVSFTTLGFGDVLLPEPWRLLGGLAAANGLLNIGIVTALLVEVLRELRRAQTGTSRT